MEWARRLADYDVAKRDHLGAQRLLADAVFRYEIARMAGAAALAPIMAGVDLALRRARRDERRLAEAAVHLTQGRDLDEVLWSVPDEV
jgi:hypothetical protein